MESKESAVAFLKLIIAGNIDEAYEKYVDMSGKHHNLFYPDNFEALQQRMKDNEAQFPNKNLAIKNVVGDGDMVAVHSYLVLKANELELVVVHLFRFKDSRIVEMWDVGQQIPKDSPNKEVI